MHHILASAVMQQRAKEMKALWCMIFSVSVKKIPQDQLFNARRKEKIECDDDAQEIWEQVNNLGEKVEGEEWAKVQGIHNCAQPKAL